MMQYTGERMIPELAEWGTFWEHIYRYRFASKAVRGKDVLDIASGEGYGTAALLQAGAHSVIGVDVDHTSCEHAKSKYGVDARLGSAENIPLHSGSVDVVISFETIEHLQNPLRFLDECARVLRRNGTLIISTPNAEAYNQPTKNPFHVRELTETEFAQQLRKRFSSIALFTQRPNKARWWSLASLSCDGSRWNRTPGSRELLSMTRRAFCPELFREADIQSARLDPISAILRKQGGFSTICNPFSVKNRPKRKTFEPAYLVAVASSPQSSSPVS